MPKLEYLRLGVKVKDNKCMNALTSSNGWTDLKVLIIDEVDGSTDPLMREFKCEITPNCFQMENHQG
eukprot:scaffold272675_cov31-Tisochrysis_lutea.AAC.8